jgi:hypothetical protein
MRWKGEGRSPSLCMRDRIRPVPAWVAATTGGDRHRRALHCVHGHRVVTGSVACGAGVVTGVRGQN